MWLKLAVLCFVVQVHTALPPAEDAAFRKWAMNATRLSLWNFAADICNPNEWQGVVCAPANVALGLPQGIESVTLDYAVQFSYMYGELPDFLEWETLKLSNQGFTRFKSFNVSRYLFGPEIPAYADRMWSNGNATNPNNPWNLIIGNFQACGVLCPLPPPFDDPVVAAQRNVGCTPINIVSIDPVHGPKSGGTNVKIKVNAPLGYINLSCSFGAVTVDGKVGDGQTVPTPVTHLYFMDYWWHDYDASPLHNDPTQYNFIEVSTSVIECTTPPHSAGAVDLRILATLSNGTTIVLTRNPRPFYFNYECPAGTEFSIVNGTSVCSSCPPGTWSPVASDRCFDCAPGSYSELPGSGSCDLCPPGTFGNITSQTNATLCYPCLPGYISPAAGASSCTPCNPGTAQGKPGQSACVNCRPGTVADGFGNTSCVTCTRGSYSPNSTQPCVPCPIGTFSVVDGAVECKNCAPGTTTSNVGQSACDVVCAEGTFRSVDFQRCVICPPGRFTNTTGAVVCTLCDIGFYNPGYNQSACLPCEEGWTTYNRGSPSCFKKSTPAAPYDRTALIIGIILLVLFLIGILIAIAVIIYKRRQQQKKQDEIEQIRKIMNGIKT